MRLAPSILKFVFGAALAPALSAGLLMTAAPATAEVTARIGADARTSGELEADRPFLSTDGRDVEFEDAARLQLGVGVEGEAFVGDHLTLGVRFDSAELTWDGGAWTIGGEEPEVEARETAFLREAYLVFEAGETAAVTLEAGKRRLTLGDGLLLDDTALGAHGRLELFDGAVGLELGLAVPGPELWPPGPPVGYARGRGNFGVVSRAEVLYARYTGTGDDVQADIARQVNLRAFENVLASAPGRRLAAATCLEPPPETTVESVLNWLGLGFDLAFEKGQLSAQWLTEFGRFDIDTRLTNADCIAFLERRNKRTGKAQVVDSLGHAASVDARYHLWGPLYPGLFGIWMSGNAGKSGAGGDYEGYLSIAPYPHRPALFFDVGATSSLRTRRTATSGLLGRGVLAAGPTLLFAPSEDLEVDLTLALLHADEENPATGARDYGQEVDLLVTFDLNDWLSALASLDATRLGDFYPQGGVYWRAALGLSARYDHTFSGD